MQTHNELAVLLIENDEGTRNVFLKSIRMNFPEVRMETADTPHAAIRMLRQTRYDMIVCDAFLPKHERLEFVSAICAEKPGAALLMVTGDTDLTKDDLPPAAKKLCVHDLIHKPLNLRDFIRKFGGAIETVKGRK